MTAEELEEITEEICHTTDGQAHLSQESSMQLLAHIKTLENTIENLIKVGLFKNAENENLQTQNEKYYKILKRIKGECLGDQTLGCHRWIIEQCSAALKEGEKPHVHEWHKPGKVGGFKCRHCPVWEDEAALEHKEGEG